jgi:addiction module RelE/StbE family toxin
MRPVVGSSKRFSKQYAKLPKQKQAAVKRVISILLRDMTNGTSTPGLRYHALRGEWLGYYSISAGGDLRLHYKVVSGDKIIFVAVGSHSQLYK